MACRYLTQPEVLKRALGNPPDFQCRRIQLEAVISKGSGQYTQHIGFADVLVEVTHSPGKEVVEYFGGKREERGTRVYELVLIEVKINPLPISDLIRQLNLYREYLKQTRALAVLDFDLTESDQRALLGAAITPIRLGQVFESWLETQQRPAKLESL